MELYRESYNPHCLGGQDAYRKPGQLGVANLIGTLSNNDIDEDENRRNLFFILVHFLPVQ